MGGGGTAKVNALRSLLVVIGASAFGYLTLQLGFKPYLEKAQFEQLRQQQQQQAQPNDDDKDTFSHSSTTTDTAAITLSDE